MDAWMGVAEGEGETDTKTGDKLDKDEPVVIVKQVCLIASDEVVG